jgi:hypothetical protein
MPRRCSLHRLAARALVLPLLLSRASVAGPAPRLVLAGRVDAVVAAGQDVAALRDGEVLLLGADGHTLGACRGADATAGVARRPDRTTLPRDEVLGEAGFSPEDVSPEAEELLDDEGVDEPSRRRPVSAAEGAPRARAIAGAPDGVWIATAEGLWRLDARDGACQRAGLGAEELALVGARGAVVVAVADATVWRSRDGGGTFEVAAVLTSPGSALALAPDGDTIYIADEDGVVEVGAARGFRRRLETRVDALAACGAAVIALGSDGVHLLDADGERLAGPRPPARTLACMQAQGQGQGQGDVGLVAAGVGLWTSPDGGIWRDEDAGLGRSFAGVAFAAGRAWLASERGLEVLESGPPPAAAVEGPPRPAPSWLEPKHAPAWAGLLPRVSIAYDGWTESVGVAGWRVWLLVTVNLGRRWHQRATQNLEDLR